MITIKQKNTYIKVFNSYEISKNDFLSIINTFDRNISKDVFAKRSIKGMINEWVVHNFAYNIHFMRKHSADVTFESDINKVLLLFYNVFGNVFKFFIK